MTNNQALQAANFSQILYASKNISFGVATRLASNAKHYEKIMEQVREIQTLGSEKEYDESEVKKEIEDFGNAEFAGSFRTINLENIENLPYEEITGYRRNEKGENVPVTFIVSDMFIYLQELLIVQ